MRAILMVGSAPSDDDVRTLQRIAPSAPLLWACTDAAAAKGTRAVAPKNFAAHGFLGEKIRIYSAAADAMTILWFGEAASIPDYVRAAAEAHDCNLLHVTTSPIEDHHTLTYDPPEEEHGVWGQHLSPVPVPWLRAVRAQGIDAEYWIARTAFLDAQKGVTVVPAPRFRLAFMRPDVPPCDVRVVILGREPDSKGDNANGLAFSTTRPDVANVVLRELHRDPGVQKPLKVRCEGGWEGEQREGEQGEGEQGGGEQGRGGWEGGGGEQGRGGRGEGEGGVWMDTTPWAMQGVLLPNQTLTSVVGKMSAHVNVGGWEILVRAAIAAVSREAPFAVFVLLGDQAQRYSTAVDLKKHKVLYAAWPAGQGDGFAFSDIFSKTNALLKQRGLQPIAW